MNKEFIFDFIVTVVGLFVLPALLIAMLICDTDVSAWYLGEEKNGLL